MIVMLVLLAICIVALLYLKEQRADDVTAQTRLDASADIEAATERLEQDGTQKAELVDAAPDATHRRRFWCLKAFQTRRTWAKSWICCRKTK
jgi:hypothetical protein